MKRFSQLLLLLALLIPALLFSQDPGDLFSRRKEVYFSFKIQSREEIRELTRVISIANVQNDSVYAYANLPEFLKFLKLDYPVTLLTHPADAATGIVMKDYEEIRNSPLTVWNYYPTYEAYEQLMTDFQTNYPSICQVTTIGYSNQNRKLMMAKISDNVSTDESEPEFLYTSSMHGNETTGYILMMHLIDQLLTAYGTNTELTDLINNMEIYICPLANPDGTYAGGNSSVSGATRSNYNGVDLNRNYPDFISGDHPDGNAWQVETVAFMNFASSHHIVAGSNYHGGTEVVNYPWDTKAALAADDAWWQYVSKEYVDTARTHGNTSYMTVLYASGITNGYAWYEANGTRQDYMNYWHHCREHTLEVSSAYILPAAQLLTYWEYNYRSMILYLKQARYGIHGIVTDAVTGLPVAAKVFVTGHDVDNSEVYSSSGLGDYHRPIKGGTWNLEVSATGYVTQTIPGVVVADHATTTLNIQLVPDTKPLVVTQAATGISGTGASFNGTVNPRGFSTTYWFEYGTTTAYGNSTTAASAGNGTSAVPVTASLTGLSAGTQYHYRLNATNANGTTNGSDMTFTTVCGTITAFPWSEGFETGGVIPACWTQEQINSSGINWTFITGNGGSYPATAHGGTYNACLKDNSAGDNVTRLISPSLNLGSVGSPTLTFWLYNRVWGSDQDVLTVYYRTSATGSWTLLATYNTSIASWTQQTIALPNATTDYYINFQGNAKYGYGICIDDVSVSGTVTLPVVSTTAATGITVSSATSGGNVTSAGSSSVTARGVCWSTAANPTVADSHTADGSGTGSFTSSITGLLPGTVYNVRAYATNSSGTAYGTNLQFTTLANLPTVSTSTPSNVTATLATSGGSITSDGGGTITARGVCWSTSANPTLADNHTSDGTGLGTFISSITGLSASTLYHVRAFATNSAGTAYGSDLTFTTSALPSLSVTPSSRSVSATSGSTEFTVTSNAGWTVVSDQSWCTVTLSGSGNGTITANYTQNTTTSQRTALITVTVTDLTPVVVSVTQAAAAPTFLLRLLNFNQTSDHTLEFDVYLMDNDPSGTFELASIQAGILLNPAFLAGGTLSAAIATPVSSGLIPSQIPTVVTYTASQSCIKLAGKTPPGAGNGTIISEVDPGTKVIRLLLTSTVPFASNSTPSFSFTSNSTSGNPYPTRVARYISGINTQLTVTPGYNALVESQPVLNGPPSLSVTPPSQNVPSTAGSTSFTISTNTAWTAVSDQPWCTPASGSGYGNATLTANYLQNTGAARSANITVTVAGLLPVVVTVSQAAAPYTSLVLKAYLEGLYDGNSMRQAADENGAHWTAPVADKITVELHDAANYATIVYSAPDVDLNTNGIATLSIPAQFSGSYYLTVSHRNSLLTVSAGPVSFAASPVSYDFTVTGAAAYGGNMIQMIDGYYAFYGGDVDQDGQIDTGDFSLVDNDSGQFITGYLTTDVTGDSFVDSADMTILDNNSALFVSSMTP